MLKFFLKHSNRKPPFLQFPCIYIIAQNNAGVCAIFWQFVLFIVILWNTVRKLSLFCVFIIRWMHSLVVSPQDTITISLFNLSTRKGHLFWVFLSALKERHSPQIFLFPWLFDIFGGRNPGLSFTIYKNRQKHYYFININFICENTLFLTKIIPYTIFYAKFLYYLTRAQRQIPHFLSF